MRESINKLIIELQAYLVYLDNPKSNSYFEYYFNKLNKKLYNIGFSFAPFTGYNQYFYKPVNLQSPIKFELAKSSSGGVSARYSYRSEV